MILNIINVIVWPTENIDKEYEINERAIINNKGCYIIYKIEKIDAY